jgi:tRNA 2-thiouridine synthesizing protein E
MNLATQTLSAAPLSPELFDPDGFLNDPSAWNDELAARIAEHDGLAPLTDRHWRVIHHIRDRFRRIGGVPAIRQVCRATGLHKSEIHRLFGSCLSIWRVAGLPNPGEEAKAYL